MIARDDADLLLALGDVAGGRSVWGAVLRVLATQMQASHATLYAQDHVWGETPPPRPACFDSLRPDRVYSAEELVDRAGPFDPDFGSGDHRVIAAKGLPLWLWIHKTRGSFRAADSARLSSLMPHIAQSHVLGQERTGLAQAFGQAQAMLWHAGLGRTGPNGPDATAARLLAEAGISAPDVAPGALRALPGGITAYGLTNNEILLRAARDLPAPARLAQALGLTLSEARLARTLGQGQSLPQASATLGLTRETGRSYAKQIYAKTGVSGQSGLVRLLWCSALAFG